jgi:hypothetical protein
MAFRGGVLVYREAGAMNASSFEQLVEAVRRSTRRGRASRPEAQAAPRRRARQASEN